MTVKKSLRYLSNKNSPDVVVIPGELCERLNIIVAWSNI